MADNPIVIASPSLVTAIGLSAQETYANAQAHVVRAGNVSLLGRRYGEYVLATLDDAVLPALVATLSPGRTARERRMLRLLALAMGGLARLPVGKPAPLFLSLPEHTTQIPLDGGKILNDLQIQCPGCIDPTRSKADWRGRAGGLSAVGEAVRALDKGEADVVVVGGVDTFLDTWVLSTLDKNGRVKTEAAVDSFIPGEGCGLLYVARADNAAVLGLVPLAVVTGVGEGFEPGHWESKEPYVGAGLSDAVGKLLDLQRPAEPITEVYSTMNGESYWAKEWGVARLRQSSRFASQAVLNHPAEFYGDLGAAAGPVLTGLAAMGLQKQADGPVLVYASSDFGPRAALLLSKLKN